MNWAQNLTVIVGKFALCYPLLAPATSKSNQLYRRFNPWRILQAAICIYSLAFTLDVWANSSLDSLTGEKLLSDKIYYLLEYSAAVVADFIIRLACVIYFHDLLHLYTDLGYLCSNTSDLLNVKSSRSSYCYVVVAICASAGVLASGLFIVYKENVEYNGKFIEEIPSNLAPNIEIVLRIVTGCLDALTHVSAAFAGLFVVCAGSSLTGVHCAQLKALAEVLGQRGEVWSKFVLGPEERFRRFKEDVKRLQGCLEKYLTVGGHFALALVFRSTVGMICAVAAIAGIADNSEFIDGGDFLLYMGDITTVVLLADFGAYMENQVEHARLELKQQQYLAECAEMKAEIKLALAWTCKWNWELTACSFFTIRRSLLLGIGQTVLGLIIFMFQLRVSEQTFHVSSNSTQPN